jgi:hypothetical protein
MTTAVESQSRCFCRKFDHRDDEGLLVQRIRVAGMAILETGGLQVGHGREVAGADVGRAWVGLAVDA